MVQRHRHGEGDRVDRLVGRGPRRGRSEGSCPGAGARRGRARPARDRRWWRASSRRRRRCCGRGWAPSSRIRPRRRKLVLSRPYQRAGARFLSGERAQRRLVRLGQADGGVAFDEQRRAVAGGRPLAAAVVEGVVDPGDAGAAGRRRRRSRRASSARRRPGPARGRRRAKRVANPGVGPVATAGARRRAPPSRCTRRSRSTAPPRAARLAA